MSASSPSAALAAALASADGLVGGRLLLGIGEDGRPLAWIRWRWHADREPWRVVHGEPGRPAEDREHGAPAHDQILLDDPEDRGHDPVDEQAGGQEPAVDDRS